MSAPMKVLVVDNYDSFTWNIVQYLQVLGAQVEVFRNDRITVQGVRDRAPDRLLISPGPCDPDRAGVSVQAIRELAGHLPILGVCLGHQTIAIAFGGRVVSAKKLMHGKVSTIESDGKQLYHGINTPFTAMRYHSLAVSREGLPDCLTISSQSHDGEIMGIRHKTHPTEGIQFHPESIMTTVGKRLLRNFLKLTGDV